MHSFIGLAKITRSQRANRCQKDTHACQFLYTVYRKWDVRCNQYKKNLTAHSRINTYWKWTTWIKLRKRVRFSQSGRSLNFGITFLVFLFLFGMQIYQNIPYDISCFCGSFGFCAVLRTCRQNNTINTWHYHNNNNSLVWSIRRIYSIRFWFVWLLQPLSTVTLESLLGEEEWYDCFLCSKWVIKL